MRTFNVNVGGSIHVIRAHDFLRPTVAPNGKWCFLDSTGQVVWTYRAEDVNSVTKTVTMTEEVPI